MDIKTAVQSAVQSAVVSGHKVSVIVPSNRDGIEFDNTNLVTEVATELSNLFGGATATYARGFWIGGAGLVVEDVQIVYSFATDAALSEHAAAVVELALWVKSAAGQESVALEADGQLYLI